MSRVSVFCTRNGSVSSNVRTSFTWWGSLATASAFIALAFAILAAPIARAQDNGGGAAAATPSPSANASPAVAIQLNKIEDVDGACRVYFVISNKTPKAFKTLKIDLILFRTDGVIGKRVFADMAPLRAQSKQQVKLFDLSGIKCSDVGSLLVNDTLECRDDDGAIDQCISRLEVSSLSNVSLSK